MGATHALEQGFPFLLDLEGFLVGFLVESSFGGVLLFGAPWPCAVMAAT